MGKRGSSFWDRMSDRMRAMNEKTETFFASVGALAGCRYRDMVRWVQTLWADMEDIKTWQSKVADALLQLTRDGGKLRFDAANLESRLSRVEADLARAQGSGAQRLTDAERGWSQASTRATQLERALDDLKRQFRTQEQQLSSMQSTLSSTQTSLRETIASFATVRDALETVKRQHTQLPAEMADIAARKAREAVSRLEEDDAALVRAIANAERFTETIGETIKR